MIKLIHTADWHLGQTFFGYDRAREHEIFLRALRRIISERGAELLLISGDIFDTSNPSAEAMKLYYGFLRDVTSDNPGMRVIAIAGNHDSGARLEAPHPVLESIDVITRGTVRRLADGTPDYSRHVVPVMRDDKTVAYCLAVPYLRAGDYPEADTYNESISLFYKGVYDHVRILDPSGTIPIIAMGHMQTSGAALSEDDRGERTITGGIECVASDMFEPRTAYTALGHLHKAQRVAGRDDVRFAGSPLPMSFSERGSAKSVCYAEIAEAGERFQERRPEHDAGSDAGEDAAPEGTPIFSDATRRIELIPMEQTAPLVRVTVDGDDIDGLSEALRSLPEGEVGVGSPYVEMRVSVSAPEPDLRRRIEEALAGRSVRLTRIEAVATGADDAEPEVSPDLQGINPMEMALEIFRRRYGGDMPEGMRNLLGQAIAEAQQQ
ncbi:MAG: exonuclease SbcCD subunit D C-terminal domain-containing protein [Rikenellaceae bacterium]|nr:exonuclease SbcCD subunit D C-terminal domain-containing protein [Rikenellaceae bacterium]